MLFFALSIVCSAVIASFSVWNLGYAQTSKSLRQVIEVDSFGIFVGGFVLVGVFTMIFIEVGRKNAFTSRVWFDCIWSGLFFSLNISLASIVTALLPSQMCSVLNTGAHNLPSGACWSTKGLQAFTWLHAIVLFAYFLTIFLTVFIYSGRDNRLWDIASTTFLPTTAIAAADCDPHLLLLSPACSIDSSNLPLSPHHSPSDQLMLRI
ncbi:hypothetical protein BDP27DRAFT_663199 [Rhodocollybia butyracea]|uniref:Uncharacterized protein n=1 Tax=Rhodocollybia butyracea TaxID=206335 RepID=A0A9P5PV50_9AGAR|nr:hypothetical protein BDP27DRAFT_663199 [Rhodocollybia butyracea]